MPRILTSYIFREMAVPFVLTAAILTVTVFLGKILKLVELLLIKQVALSYVLLFILSVMPSFLIYILPASFLVAVLIACTRLSSDNEITAMKASGISHLAIAKPVFFLALTVCSATLAVTLYLYPLGNRNLNRILFEVAKANFTSGMEEKSFYDGFKNVVLYADNIPPAGNELRGVFIYEKPEGGESTVVTAERGVFAAAGEEGAIMLRLENGEIHRRQSSSSTYHRLSFSSYTLDLDLSGGAEKRGVSNKEAYAGELLKKLRESDRKTPAAVSFGIELHKRFAIPASIFVFALLGMPLGMQKVRQARFTGFGISIGVITVYYILSRAFEAAAYNFLIGPGLAAWGSIIILGSIGLYIFIMAALEKPVISTTALSDAAAGLRAARRKIFARGRQ